MVAKYSPTIASIPNEEDQWFYENGGGWDNGFYPDSMADDDGYDSYGYSVQDDTDREGYREDEYQTDSDLMDRVESKYRHCKHIDEVNEVAMPTVKKGDLVEVKDNGIRLFVMAREDNKVILGFRSPSDETLYNNGYDHTREIFRLHVDHVKKVQ